MNTVVDEVLNTSATDNKVKYRITYSDNTSDIVELDLYTPVTTQGTPINRTLFESIRTDLTNLNNNKENVDNKTNTINSSSTTTQYPNAKAVYNQLATKLNISSKSTTAQAQAGTDDTNYMTALKVVQAITQQNANKVLATYSSGGSAETQPFTDTVVTFDNKKTMILITIDLYGVNSGTYKVKVQMGNETFNNERSIAYILYDRRTNTLISAESIYAGSIGTPTIAINRDTSITNITCTHKFGNASHYAKVNVIELF